MLVVGTGLAPRAGPVPRCREMWVLLGRTLAPVERIRAEAAEISGREFHRRVPDRRGKTRSGASPGTLNGMLGRLEDGLDRQRRFVTDAAHELRTPITSSRTDLETARSSPRRIDRETTADDVLAGMARLQRLTEQLLLLAVRMRGGSNSTGDRSTSTTSSTSWSPGSPQVQPSSTPPRSGARSCGETRCCADSWCGTCWRTRGTTPRSGCGSGCARTGRRPGSQSRTTGPGSRPTSGSGCSRASPGPTMRGAVRGTGLGLAIVADIARAHHGAVTVLEGELDGARFEVLFPNR